VYESKRLTSHTSHFMFIAAAFIEPARTITNWGHLPIIQWVFLPVVLLYMLVGTIGWTQVNRHQRAIYAYFVIMVLLACLIMLISSWSEGVLSGILSILLLPMHGAILPKYARLSLILVLCGCATACWLMFNQHLGRIGIFSPISAYIGFFVFDYIGNIVVSEERAREQVATYARMVEDIAIMRERTRLARDLHDSLGHYLTAIHMQAQAAQAVLYHQPQQTEEALTHISSLARDGLQEVRKSIEAIRTLPTDNRPLPEALAILVKQNPTNSMMVFQTLGAPIATTPETNITLYRIVQEALTNIHKHAQAQQITITLRYDTAPNRITLRIQDDGVGATSTEGGFGLIGLKERVRLLNGTLDIQTAHGEGFCMEAHIPL
jgi:signal transduction histidine kinase